MVLWQATKRLALKGHVRDCLSRSNLPSDWPWRPRNWKALADLQGRKGRSIQPVILGKPSVAPQRLDLDHLFDPYRSPIIYPEVCAFLGCFRANQDSFSGKTARKGLNGPGKRRECPSPNICFSSEISNFAFVLLTHRIKTIPAFFLFPSLFHFICRWNLSVITTAQISDFSPSHVDWNSNTIYIQFFLKKP